MRAHILAATAALAATIPVSQAHATKPVQHIVISFDGAFELEQWDRSRALADETGARFTYFLSCVYLLSPETRAHYTPPPEAPGRSNVGFGQSAQEVATRLNHVWTTFQAGHEIASHGCGHFDGAAWPMASWLHEFDQFSEILREAWKINGLDEPDGWRAFAERSIEGFRAPYLATGQELFTALSERGFLYDASTVSNGPVAPVEDGGLARFSLPMIPEGPNQRPVIAMDYNLYVRHSRAEERPAEAHLFEERAFAAFQKALETEMAGERRPLQIGLHFRLMNDGAYWRALERFVRDNCGKPDVACVSYAELVRQQRAGDSTSATD